MKTILSALIILHLVAIGLCLLYAVITRLPFNDRPCFGKTKDGHYRWHAYSECAH